jgi:hypothetical protein
MMQFPTITLVGFVACAIFSTSAQLAAQATSRLILKDGSYQIVTKYELEGDRVHYYSAERAEWEDVPSDMVNWEATRQYASDSANGKNSPNAKALAKEMEEERQEEERTSPHVAPGLRLPSEGGVYALDSYLSEPELLPLDQNSGEVNRQVGRNVLRSAVNPISGSKRTVEVAGPSAKVQIHASLPTIYINLEPVDEDAQTAIERSASQPANPQDQKSGGSDSRNSRSNKSSSELPWDRFRIVRVQVKGDKRIVGATKTGFTGKQTQEQDLVPATAEQFGEGWVKLTPKAPLAPGEYALVEMLGTQGMNSYVWDFGVHPDAPANMSVIKPVRENRQPAQTPAAQKH